MKKVLTLFALLFVMVSVNAQTATELTGQWKLVKWIDKKGNEKDIREYFKTTEVYQVFDADGKFQSLVGEKITKGKWKLSKDNKKLTVTVLLINEVFDVDFFDAKKRVISTPQLGTFEYEKQ